MIAIRGTLNLKDMDTDFSFMLGETRVPAFLYGTAWKEDDTERCVEAAPAAGFRGIDTANQQMSGRSKGCRYDQKN